MSRIGTLKITIEFVFFIGGGQADGLLRKIYDDCAHAVVLPQERKKHLSHPDRTCQYSMPPVQTGLFPCQ